MMRAWELFAPCPINKEVCNKPLTGQIYILLLQSNNQWLGSPEDRKLESQRSTKAF
jgi:hypothetical protein